MTDQAQAERLRAASMLIATAAFRKFKGIRPGQPVEPQPASALTGISGSGPGRLPGAAAPLDVPPSPVHPAGVVGERAS